MSDRAIPSRLRVLRDSAVERIHETSLRILSEIGIGLTHRGALEALADAGCAADCSAGRARFPEAVVMESVARAGKQHTYFGRDRNRRARFGQGTCNFLSIAGEHAWVEVENRHQRPPVMDDARQAIRLGDALPQIDIVGAMALPHELPREVVEVHVFAELVKGTTKPFMAWCTSGGAARFIVEMLRVVASGADELRRYPMVEGFYEPISPLRFHDTGLDMMVVYAEAGLPIGFGPMAQAASSAPATLAGTIAQENAEILAAVTILQLLVPGTSVTYWGIPHIMDPQRGTCVFGSPEQGLMAVAMTQIGKFYGFPVGINVGLTDANLPDAQAGLEKGMTCLLGALAGADIFGHQGIAGADQGASLEQLVIDNEMAAMIRRTLRGFEVSEETLAFDTIAEVGIGGTYVAEQHTLKHFRHEFWLPTLCSRLAWGPWLSKGGKTMLELATQRKRELLATHAVEPLPEDVAAEVDRVAQAANCELLAS